MINGRLSRSMFRPRIILFQISAARKCLRFLAFWCRKHADMIGQISLFTYTIFLSISFQWPYLSLEIYDLGQSVDRFVETFTRSSTVSFATLLFYRTRPAPSPHKMSHSSSNPILRKFQALGTRNIRVQEKSGRNEDSFPHFSKNFQLLEETSGH